MAKGGVTVKDNGYNAVVRELRTLGHDISIGIHEPEGAEQHEKAEGLTVLQLAVWHEFGVPEGAGVEDGNPPMRSFVRTWFDERRDWFYKQIRTQARAIIKKKGRLRFDTAAKQLALVGEGDMKSRIYRGQIVPPLTQETIDQKGSALPLFDTGQLAGSIEGKTKRNR